MDQHTLRVLEFYKVREILKGYASSEPGRAEADLVAPSADPAWVRRSLKEAYELTQFLENRNDLPLAGLKDVSGQLSRSLVEGSMLNPRELLDVAGVARASRLVKAALSKVRERFPALSARADGLGVFRELEVEVENAISGEAEVLDSASFELKRIRRGLSTIKARINKELERILQDPAYAKAVQEQVITLRGDRYVIPLKPNFKMYLGGIVHDYSTTRSTVFVEPERTVELNNKLAQLRVEEAAEIERILWKLTTSVRGFAEELLGSLDALAGVDLLYAKASYALATDADMPALSDRGVLDLRAARHPLLIAALGKDVVPVDVRLGEDYACMVITGPNTGGKTVVLKTVGLLALMAQAGMLIPASPDSVVPVYSQVFSDIGDEQSVEQSLSTFSAHMGQIVRILKAADRGTLVLLDELGAGTDPAEGSALGVAILEELHRLGAKVVVTTHHGALKLFAANTKGATNASVEFDPETLMPTYRLLVGRPGRSNALVVAKRLGMPESVLGPASSAKGEQDVRMDGLIDRLDREAKAARVDREAAARELEEARRERARLEAQLARAEADRREAVAKAKEKAGGVLRSLRLKLRELEEMGKKQPEKAEVRRVEREVRRLDAELKFEEAAGAPTAKLDINGVSEGDTVGVYKYKKQGTVLKVLKDRGQVIVQVGPLKVTLGVDELEPGAGRKKAAQAGGGTVTAGSADGADDFGPAGEINLVGKRVEEALGLLDKYVDRCLMYGMGKVRVIHGRGTGALRAAVRDMLAGHMGVASFESADPREGGDAVTVATLRQ
jgi:DNA mismatch repair protein MutS2